MTDSEILARWQGLDSHNCDPHSFHCDGCERGSIQTPDYLNDEAACGSLLDTLVEKGYTPIFEYARYIAPHCWICEIESPSCKEADRIRRKGRTRCEAIVAACLEVAQGE